MPRGDGTGPWAAGPMTGRGAGYCGGGNAPGYESAPGGGRGGFGRGGGRGAGGGSGRGGRGNRNQYFATGLTGWERGVRGVSPQSATSPAAPELTREEELAAVHTQAENIEQALNDIRQRLADLEGE